MQGPNIHRLAVGGRAFCLLPVALAAERGAAPRVVSMKSLSCGSHFVKSTKALAASY